MTPEWAARFRQCIQLGVRPAEFWALSLPEWLALITLPTTTNLPRDDLHTLMTLFPDNKK